MHCDPLQGSGDAKAQEKYADAVKKLAQLEGALKGECCHWGRLAQPGCRRLQGQVVVHEVHGTLASSHLILLCRGSGAERIPEGRGVECGSSLGWQLVLPANPTCSRAQKHLCFFSTSCRPPPPRLPARSHE